MKKHKFAKKILIFSLILIFLIPIGYLYYLYNQIGKLKTVPLPKNNDALGINPIILKKQDNTIRNIALFGIDTGRSKDDVPHSDSIIIVTIDKSRNKLKLTSILRDTYVKVEHHGKMKITEAYAVGGANLAVKTLNQNFNLNIKDYITVDFFGMAKIIDSIGGISVDVKRYEIKEVNKYIKELAEIENKNIKFLKKDGIQELDGIQTVAYARIRKVGDGDFERSIRHRTVLNQVLAKIKDDSISKVPTLVSNFIPMVQTSITRNDIIDISSYILTSNINSIDQQRFPLDGYCTSKFINHIWYLVPIPGIEETSKQINGYIFEDKLPTPKAPLF